MILFRRIASLAAALAVATLPVTAGPVASRACENPPHADGSQDILVGQIEFGDNNNRGLHAGYVSPGGGAYTYAGAGSDGAQIWVGASSVAAFVGVGPGYPNFNQVCVG